MGVKKYWPISIWDLNRDLPRHIYLCTEQNCIYSNKCANHYTAGEFRTEGGPTPDIKHIQGKICCSKTLLESTGAVCNDGTLCDGL